jgi:hypothetical protein
MNYPKLPLHVHLLEIQLLRHMFSMGAISSRRALYCSLMQFTARPPATTYTGAFGKYDFIYANTWFGIDFARCLTYVAKCPGAYFSLSTSGAILGPPGCGTSSLTMASAASSSSFS